MTNITPKIIDKHGTFDMSRVVAVINDEQWRELHELAYGNLKLQKLMLDLLSNDDLYKN